MPAITSQSDRVEMESHFKNLSSCSYMVSNEIVIAVIFGFPDTIESKDR